MTSPYTIRKAFSGSAPDYESVAVVQKRVRNRVFGLISEIQAVPEAILDIGAGTGALLNEISKLFSSAALFALDSAHEMNRQSLRNHPIRYAVTADAEMLPFKDNCFDLVVSSSAFQWLSSLESAFTEARRVLKPGGIFIFSLFGGDTLFELRTSYREAVKAAGRGVDRTRSFHDIENTASALDSAGFKIDRLWVENEKEEHPSVPALLRAIRGTGASTPSVGFSSFAEGVIMKKMITIYCEKFSNGATIPATYQVIYGVASKNQQR